MPLAKSSSAFPDPSRITILARTKAARESNRQDHDLRLLLAHVRILDQLEHSAAEEYVATQQKLQQVRAQKARPQPAPQQRTRSDSTSSSSSDSSDDDLEDMFTFEPDADAAAAADASIISVAEVEDWEDWDS